MPAPAGIVGRRMKVGVLASGAGTNLQALIDHVHGRDGVRAGRGRLRQAGGAGARARRAAGIADRGVRASAFADRAARDRAMADWLRERGSSWSCSPATCSCSPTSSWPLSRRGDQRPPVAAAGVPGLEAVEQALDYGVKVFGVTVHFVDGGVDTGPVILQRAIELPGAREPEEVLARLHAIEHELLPEAVGADRARRRALRSRNPRRVVIDR